jgi:hypothetical protein
MHLRMGTVGEGEREWGGRGGLVYSQPGTRVDGDSSTTQRREFQVSKGRVPRNKGRDFQATKGGYQKGVWSMHLRVYIMLIKDCV